MTHPWKIGDWCETKIGERAVIVDINSDSTLRLYRNGLGVNLFDATHLKHLPLCDSWTWQPPSPPDPGEGYRPIDPAVDVPQEGDEYWSPGDRRWQERSITFSRTAYRKSYHYRRKLPTYAPFTAESFKPHRDRWIRHRIHGEPRIGAWRVDGYAALGYWMHGSPHQQPWSTLLDHVFDDTNTPCGVPQ